MTPTDAPRAEVLVVDDEPMVREVVATYLARDGLVVHEAADGAAAEAWLDANRPDLVVLDVMLPGTDGLSILRRLRTEGQVPVILLTARADEVDRIVGLELGADDYVVKPFSSAEVIARIRAVLRRTGRDATTAPDPPVEIDGLRLDPGARSATLDGAPLDLSRKEFDLLARLMRDAGRVVTREDLMADVWDENWFGSTKTLDVHVGFLRRKLDDDAADPRFLHTVRGVGFRFTGPDGT